MPAAQWWPMSALARQRCLLDGIPARVAGGAAGSARQICRGGEGDQAPFAGDVLRRRCRPIISTSASAEYLLGEVCLETNRLSEAEAMLTASMNRWKRTDAPAWRSARSASALGEALYRQGRTREAEHYLTASLQSTRGGRERRSRRSREGTRTRHALLHRSRPARKTRRADARDQSRDARQPAQSLEQLIQRRRARRSPELFGFCYSLSARTH